MEWRCQRLIYAQALSEPGLAPRGGGRAARLRARAAVHESNAALSRASDSLIDLRTGARPCDHAVGATDDGDVQVGWVGDCVEIIIAETFINLNAIEQT